MVRQTERSLITMSRSGSTVLLGSLCRHNRAGIGKKDCRFCSGALIKLFAFVSPATFPTIQYRLPVSLPFLAPRKGETAGLADFGGF